MLGARSVARIVARHLAAWLLLWNEAPTATRSCIYQATFAHMGHRHLSLSLSRLVSAAGLLQWWRPAGAIVASPKIAAGSRAALPQQPQHPKVGRPRRCAAEDLRVVSRLGGIPARHAPQRRLAARVGGAQHAHSPCAGKAAAAIRSGAADGGEPESKIK